MAKTVKVAIYGSPLKAADIEQGATVGAVFGKSLWNEDGSLVTAAQFAGTTPPGPVSAVCVWHLTLRDIPRNVTEVEELDTAGIVVRQSSSDWITRSILPTVGRTTIANGDGAGGDIVVDLAVVPNDAGGTVQLTEFDTYGRAIRHNAATTDDLDEGGTNLYYTDARAVNALETTGPDYLQLLLDEYNP